MKKSKKILSISVAMLLAAISAPSIADGEGRPDLLLIASNNSYAPQAPTCFKNIGYWDVDKGGGFGAYNQSTGGFMMGMYMPDKRVCPQAQFTDVEDIILIASERFNADPFWQNAYGLYDYNLIGYWDVDKGGAQGHGGSIGANKLFMYVKPFVQGKSNKKLIDLQLRVHDGFNPPSAPGPQYVRAGFWDVDGKRGDTLSKGTDGSRGHNIMALFAKYDYNH